MNVCVCACVKQGGAVSGRYARSAYDQDTIKGAAPDEEEEDEDEDATDSAEEMDDLVRAHCHARSVAATKRVTEQLVG